MDNYISSDFKLGIIAGGQLGKLLALAANQWDIQTYVLDPHANCPASKACTQHILGDYHAYNDVYEFGKKVDLLTFEIEHINIDALLQLQKEGKQIYPEPHVLKCIQDKSLQKKFYSENNLPTAAYHLFKNKQEVLHAIESGSIKMPFIQKINTSGYDGKGVAGINHHKELEKLMDAPCVIEEKIAIQKELAVIVARNNQNEIKAFPAVEMEFNAEAHLVEQLISPASIPPSIEQEVQEIAKKIITRLNMTGLLAVEFFLDKNNKVWVNEVAPRPHNSGHHTIESNFTSQYEQQLRAILGYPLGHTGITIPSIMINILGEKGYKGKVQYEGMDAAMKIEGVKIHIYGKDTTTPFRKMGHVTILDHSIESVRKKAQTIKEHLKVKS